LSCLNPYLHLEAAAIMITIILLSLKFKFMDYKGILTAAPIGYLIYVFGGRTYFLFLIVFYVVSSVVTRFRARKVKEVLLNEKEVVRSWKNVLANGTVATIVAVLSSLESNSSPPVYFAAYLGAVGTSFADTLATELGIIYSENPRLITNFKRARRGTPGAVSLSGYLAGFSGLTLFSLLAYPLQELSNSPTSLILSIYVSGLTGLTIDSILGATIQARYRCRVCGKETESQIHCNTETEKIGGTKIIDTHTVNLLSTLIGAITATATILAQAKP